MKGLKLFTKTTMMMVGLGIILLLLLTVLVLLIQGTFGYMLIEYINTSIVCTVVGICGVILVILASFIKVR